MKFGDIIALAKQGFTPQDIKDLLAISDDQGSDKEAEQKDPEQAPDQVEAEPEAQPDTKEPANEDLDYKSLYEAEAEKTAKLQKMVLSADMSGNDDKQSDADIFADVMKSFM